MKQPFTQAFQLTAFSLQIGLLLSVLGGIFYLVFQMFLEPDSFMLAAELTEVTALVALTYMLLAWLREKALVALPAKSRLAKLKMPSDLRVIYFAILVVQTALIVGFSVFTAAMSAGNKGPGQVSDWNLFCEWLRHFGCFLLLYWALSKARSRLFYLSTPLRRASNFQLPA